MTHEQAFELVKRTLSETFNYDPADVALFELSDGLRVDLSLNCDEQVLLLERLEVPPVDDVYSEWWSLRDVVEYVVKHKGDGDA